uniref:Uncharacterized protein n=1 Tax=Spongospora subterranea TaxID=70186 RepID=A0A0H5RD91_9EUKA|eukprot:CRZ12220.1 hypothetical protein [Spongospora subterranea]
MEMDDPDGLLTLIDKRSADSRTAATLVSFDSEVSELKDANIDMHFYIRIAKNLVDKEKSDEVQKTVPRNPFMPPFETGLLVAECGDHHRLLLNKFNLVDRHVLLVTNEFVPQNSSLTQELLTQLIMCIVSINGLAFHNFGEHSGASQPHLHVQVIPRFQSELIRDAPLSQLIAKSAATGDRLRTPSVISALPFKHLVVCFGEGEFNINVVERFYRSMLLELDVNTDSSYSFLLTVDYMMIVPRSSSSHDGIGLNSLAYAGFIFLKGEQQLQTLHNIGGPSILLTHLAFPTSKSLSTNTHL